MTDDTATIHGRLVELSPTRSVWMGQWPGEEDSFAIKFTNDGVETKIRLSNEAIKAIADLHAALTASPQMWVVHGGWRRSGRLSVRPL